MRITIVATAAALGVLSFAAAAQAEDFMATPMNSGPPTMRMMTMPMMQPMMAPAPEPMMDKPMMKKKHHRMMKKQMDAQ